MSQETEHGNYVPVAVGGKRPAFSGAWGDLSGEFYARPGVEPKFLESLVGRHIDIASTVYLVTEVDGHLLKVRAATERIE